MDNLQRVVSLAELLRKQRDDLAKAEDQLKDAKAALARTARNDLPQLMIELGLSEVRLVDGSLIGLKEEVDCKIPEARRAAAINWLVSNGFGGIVKTEVAASFGSGELDTATEALAVLMRYDNGAKMQSNVHHSTLKSFVKEQLAAGTNIPFDLFGIHPYELATIKEAR